MDYEYKIFCSTLQDGLSGRMTHDQKPGFLTNTSLPPADSVNTFDFAQCFVGVHPGMNRLSGLFHKI
ncbi:MAG TPA: hypothetical protein DD001_23880 [Microcoleaceae bacterium UBA10368]|nr:hypothetical protein [Microcoleaceae cyanobacterium UBA10368]